MQRRAHEGCWSISALAAPISTDVRQLLGERGRDGHGVRRGSGARAAEEATSEMISRPARRPFATASFKINPGPGLVQPGARVAAERSTQVPGGLDRGEPTT